MRSRDALPAVCLKKCIAANDDKVNEAPLFFSPECEGPIGSTDGKVHSDVHVNIETGDTIVVDPSVHVTEVGHLVCRNVGLHESLKALQQ